MGEARKIAHRHRDEVGRFMLDALDLIFRQDHSVRVDRANRQVVDTDPSQQLTCTCSGVVERHDRSIVDVLSAQLDAEALDIAGVLHDVREKRLRQLARSQLDFAVVDPIELLLVDPAVELPFQHTGARKQKVGGAPNRRF